MQTRKYNSRSNNRAYGKSSSNRSNKNYSRSDSGSLDNFTSEKNTHDFPQKKSFRGRNDNNRTRTSSSRVDRYVRKDNGDVFTGGEGFTRQRPQRRSYNRVNSYGDREKSNELFTSNHTESNQENRRPYRSRQFGDRPSSFRKDREGSYDNRRQRFGNSRPQSNRNAGRGRNSKSVKIAHEKYIAKAIESETPQLYDEDVKYIDFALEAGLKANIVKKGYEHPTKIQAETIPLILEGKDVLGLASTGSGKTAAFLIPLINKSLKDFDARTLVIVPTRELAMQIEDEFRSLAKGLSLKSAVVIGGDNMGKQIRALKGKPEFVFGTPGRLKDLEQKRALNLSVFGNIVLDEVDRMLDMGFIADIKYLISKLKVEKQSLFFSATMSKEGEVIANTLLKSPVKIQTSVISAHKNVEQDIVKVKSHTDKLEVLAKLLADAEFEKVLIFSRTKRGADKLSRKLYQHGFKVDSIHGDKTQSRRSKIMSKFRNNEINILVATDVAARGIDIPDISHVINYDEPENYEDYIHRIGRTGRIGKKGKALTFVA